MMELNKYKEERIRELRKRLVEIDDLVCLETTGSMLDRKDAFAQKVKEKNVALMKTYYDEMTGIKTELAKLEGRRSIFEEEI